MQQIFVYSNSITHHEGLMGWCHELKNESPVEMRTDRNAGVQMQLRAGEFFLLVTMESILIALVYYSEL